MNHIVSGALALFLLTSPLSAIAHDTGTHTATRADGPVVTLGDLQISGAFARATLPNAPVGAGYVTIVNTGTSDDRLVSASSPIAGVTQLHEMKMVNDIMQMNELPNGIVIPAGQTVTLEPGGLHIMLMNLNGPLKEGETFALTLTFEKAGTVEVQVPIGPFDAAAGGHMDMDEMSSMDETNAGSQEAKP
jgi:copper(I)-binding protein